MSVYEGIMRGLNEAIEHVEGNSTEARTPKRITNADRIRSLTNMELAEMLVRYDSDRYGYYCPDGSFCTDEDSALSFALDWLEQPAKEEEHGTA